MNQLIEAWKQSAKMVYDSETEYAKLVHTDEKPYERSYPYKYLAQMQINLINETRPNKDKPFEEQLNEMQKECIEYLKKVVEKDELL